MKTGFERAERTISQRGRLLLAALLLFPSTALGQAQVPAKPEPATISPPTDWPLERRREYLTWSERVVAGCRGVNPKLDQAFDEVVTEARKVLGMLGMPLEF